MLDHGATTIWERWDGWSAGRGFQSAWMNSFNHYSLGSVAEWLYRFVLGIDQEPGSCGFRSPVLRPHPCGPQGPLRWAAGTYRSVRGVIGARWEVSDGWLTYRVELPPGVTATVRMPGQDGVPETVYEAGPGTHEFTGPLAG
jgi:alpha-L-rhamnosidase